MEIQLTAVEPGLLSFRCQGALDRSLLTAPADPLRTQLTERAWQGNVLLDLEAVTLVTTEGLAGLAHWHCCVAQTGGILGLCSPPPMVRSLIISCGLDRLLPLWDNMTAARLALAGPVSPPAAAVAPAPVSGTDTEDFLAIESELLPMSDPGDGILASEEPSEVMGMPGGSSTLPPASAVRVLVVDDSAVERRRAGGALERPSGPDAAGGGMHVLYANNGREALKIIQQERPSLVVTDLMMPGLDGLGLVKEIRASYPSIPVVLMTAHGSEEIAAAALRAGAASYVPKKFLARDLGETVDTILGLVQADREQLIFPHLAVAEYRFLLPCNPALVSPLVDFLQGHLERARLGSPVDALRVAVALREALVNAMTHGCLEAPCVLKEADYPGFLRCLNERQGQSPYKDRHVHVSVRETPQEVVYTIRDEGPGFNTTALPSLTDLDSLKKATGRGLYLIRSFMDEVRFNDTGNEITLVKRRSD